MPRKQKKYHYIYKITNLLSGKYYLGMHSTDDLYDGYMGSGRRIRYSINKYGVDNHKKEIIEFCKSRKELLKREEEIVNLNEIAKEECMNLSVGGRGPLHYKHTEEARKKISESNTGRILSEEHKEKIRQGNLNKFVSEETRKKLRKQKLGKLNPMSNGHKEETKLKISESCKGKRNTPEQRKRQSLAQMKPINQFTKDGVFIKKWDSQKSIYESLKILATGDVCNGNRKSAGGYKWEWA